MLGFLKLLLVHLYLLFQLQAMLAQVRCLLAISECKYVGRRGAARALVSRGPSLIQLRFQLANNAFLLLQLSLELPDDQCRVFARSVADIFGIALLRPAHPLQVSSRRI